ncbi:MAG: DNA-processing protein DprA [Longimicrobiales bacterium]
MVGPGMTPEVEAILRLKMTPGVGDRTISALVTRLGSGVSALRALRAQRRLFEPPEAPPPASEWVERGILALPLTSERYPAALRELSDPPPLLLLRGQERLLEGPAVAVVGARRATEGGRRVAEALGRTLGAAGIVVVSGLALGIDGAAHRGALSVGGRTVAVLGSGLDVVYPPGHRRLFGEIGARGLLLSEFLPWEAALPHHFPRRNRIIAALVRAIIVVEAGERSGALITVDHGLDLGREILAVPGSLHNPQARGTNALIRDGARLVSSPEDILDEFPALVKELAADRDSDQERPERASPDHLSPGVSERELPRDLRSLWGVLGPEPCPIDTIASAVGLPHGEVLARLSTLELLGRASRCPGMRFRRA